MALKKNSQKKQKKDYSVLFGIILLGSGILAFLYYVVTGKIMPCNIQVTVSALISFGIAFAYKLLERGDK
jgi:hypothetical protein